MMVNKVDHYTGHHNYTASCIRVGLLCVNYDVPGYSNWQSASSPLVIFLAIVIDTVCYPRQLPVPALNVLDNISS